MKKFAIAVLAGLTGLSLIGVMALVVFGVERLLRATGVLGH